MTNFTQYSIETAPEASKPGLENAKKAFGFLPNLQTFMAESPALLNSYSTMWDLFHKQASLNPIEQQVVLLTVNYENGCQYCMAGHTTLAKMIKMDEVTLSALRDGKTIPDAKLQALREFTRKVVVERGVVSDTDIEAFLTAGYSKANVFDVITGVALKVMSNYTNHITHTPLDDFMKANVWTHHTKRNQAVYEKTSQIENGLMSLTQDLEKFRQEFSAKMPRDILDLMEKADAELAEQQFLRNALKTGDIAPDFSLPDTTSKPVSLYEKLNLGPVILVFYRGGWCPYCNLTLRDYQRKLPAIRDAGALLIAVSPQSPDNSLTTQEKNALTFPVLSDLESNAAKSFGILFTLPDYLQKLYRRFGHSLDEINADGTWALPVPATYVIAPDRHIVAHHVEIDYRTRLEPHEALAAAIKISQKLL